MVPGSFHQLILKLLIKEFTQNVEKCSVFECIHNLNSYGFKMYLTFQKKTRYVFYFQTASTPEGKLKAYLQICAKFQPVFRHFFLENFPDPPVWFQRRLGYTRSVATNSIGLAQDSCQIISPSLNMLITLGC